VRTAVVTIASGRHEHLAAQAAALGRSSLPPDAYVVVAMDDPQIAAVVPEATVVAVPRVHGALPLAGARNAGVARAKALGAELLVLLDVDCLPDPDLLGRYAEVALDRDGVLCGPVGYLPPRPSGGYPALGLRELARPHPARPVPADREVLPADDPDLFWSLSFALTAATWDRLGGFCEDFYGYGGEDTDFGHTVARAEVGMWWVGGAWAYHQHHGGGGPPVQHLADVVRNAGVFHDRWGWWPMRGWLEEFARRGLAAEDPATGRWAVR
jgi:GT2 family glycosyltransferase